MGWWNFRVMKRLNKSGEYDFGIYEVHYDDEGKVKGWTRDSMVPVCSSEKGLLYEFEFMKTALQKETLLYIEEEDESIAQTDQEANAVPLIKHPCPCCGYQTFGFKPYGSYDICPVCFWEDDPIQLKGPDCESGANHLSLRQAQKNFMKYGAMDKDMIYGVRQPLPDEARDESWKPLE